MIVTVWGLGVVQQVELQSGNITKENTGLEGILSFNTNSFKVTFLKEAYNESYRFLNHFYFVKGLGGHAGYMNTDHYTFWGTHITGKEAV